MSVYNKKDVEIFAKKLIDLGYRIIATGGTKTYLEAKGISCIEVSTFTDKAEVFDGRLKTISYEILGGILFDRQKENHKYDVEKYAIPHIDIVVCNLYPFKDSPSIEMIDIGGPNMIRAAAKNYRYITVVANPNDYREAMDVLEHHEYNAAASVTFRKKLAKKAFGIITDYDQYIFAKFSSLDPEVTEEEVVPIRYGENPHQHATIFLNDAIRILPYGKTISYNNILDISSATAIVARFKEPAAVVIKHNNPCGFAVTTDRDTAFRLAWAGDEVSAFGSVVALNTRVSSSFLDEIEDKYIEVLAAPSFSQKFLQAIKDTKKNLRLITFDASKFSPIDGKSTNIGMLLQDKDEHFEALTIPADAPKLFHDNQFLRFSEIAVASMKSNAVALTMRIGEGKYMLLAAGFGQPNRVDCVRELIAPKINVSKEKLEFDSILASSDAFLPFPDLIDEMSELGLQYLMQPGGSKNDELVVTRAKEKGIYVLMTGRRHFLH